MKLGIIGYGKMGKWFGEKLKDRFEIGIFDIKPVKLENSKIIRYSSLEDLIIESDIILIATSLKVTPEVLEDVREIITKNKLSGKIIFDIASLKDKVVPILEKFPKSVKVCSVHPLFGNRAKSFESQKVVIIPIKDREDDCLEVKSLFKSLGAKVVFSDPKTHDRAISFTIVVPYFIGVTFGYLISRENISFLNDFGGPSFEHFLRYSKAIAKENSDFVFALFDSISSYEAIKKFLQLAKEVAEVMDDFSRFDAFLKEFSKHLFIDDI